MPEPPKPRPSIMNNLLLPSNPILTLQTHPSSSLHSVNETLAQSRRLIGQMQSRRLADRSSKAISREGGAVRESERKQSSRKLLGMKTRDKIEGTLQYMSSNRTIAEQVLYRNDDNTVPSSRQPHSHKTVAVPTASDMASNKSEYLNIIEHIYSKSRRKKGKKLTLIQEEEDSPRIGRASRRQLQLQAQGAVQASVGLRGAQVQQQSEEGSEGKRRQAKLRSQLKLRQQQQLDNIDKSIKSRSTIPASPTNALTLQGANANMRSQYDNISIRINHPTDRHQDQPQNEGEGECECGCDSEKGAEKVGVQGKEGTAPQKLVNLMTEIEEQIEGLRRRSARGGVVYTEGEERDDGDSKKQGDQRKEGKQRTKNGKTGRESGLYSFRPGKAARLFDIPVEEEQIVGQGGQHGQNPHASTGADPAYHPYSTDPNSYPSSPAANPFSGHPSHNLPLTQSRMQHLLSQIQTRIRLSAAVLQPVPYQHPHRQDNNQLQLQTRYIQEVRARQQIIAKIDNYMRVRAKFNSTGNATVDNRWSGTVTDAYRKDSAGKRVLADRSIWRSPSPTATRPQYQKNIGFYSLESPMLNPNSCCSPEGEEPDRTRYKNRLAVKLLASRSMDTLDGGRRQRGLGQRCEDGEGESSEMSVDVHERQQRKQGKQGMQGGCIMSEKQWGRIARLRRQLEAQLRDLNSQNQQELHYSLQE